MKPPSATAALVVKKVASKGAPGRPPFDSTKPPSVALALVQRRAAEAVLAVLSGNNADTALARVDTSGFDGATRAALTDLTYGTLRFLGELRAIVRQFVHAKPEPQIEALLWVAIYELAHSKTASHVIVSQAVAAVETINRGADRKSVV